MIQGSDEWKAARLGKVTASRVADIVAKTKSGPSASRANYMADLIAERLTGAPTEGYTSREMQWGTDNEGAARSAYEWYRDAEVEQVAIVEHPFIKMSAASPDGLVSDDGLVEIKCPNTATHIETLLHGGVPLKYVTQMQWQMACTSRLWCDFVSFDPRLPEAMRLFVTRIERDDKYILELEAAVDQFLVELTAKVAALTVKYAEAA